MTAHGISLQWKKALLRLKFWFVFSWFLIFKIIFSTNIWQVRAQCLTNFFNSYLLSLYFKRYSNHNISVKIFWKQAFIFYWNQGLYSENIMKNFLNVFSHSMNKNNYFGILKEDQWLWTREELSPANSESLQKFEKTFP